jgi:Flp pilus assembly pilin Flp
MKDLVLSFWRNESGQDLADYALLLALIALALIVVITAYGDRLQAKFSDAARVLQYRR